MHSIEMKKASQESQNSQDLQNLSVADGACNALWLSQSKTHKTKSKQLGFQDKMQEIDWILKTLHIEGSWMELTM